MNRGNYYELKIYNFFNIPSSATLKETFTTKYNSILPKTPEARPKSDQEIYTPKRDGEHPRPFHVGVTLRSKLPPR